MAKIKFDKPGEHGYETGVSECVLFVKNANGTYNKGVAWNGISSISESPEGAEETAIYADNIKYLSLFSVEEYKGSIEAYTYPKEFEKCDGCAPLSSTVAGVKISQQDRSSFALVYKTKKGVDGNPNKGYVLHIVYGATATPSEKAYETVNESPNAITFSFSFTTVPVEVAGHKPTAHVEIDSTEFTAATAAKLTEIVNSLYGTDGEGEEDVGTEPTLLLPDDILEILEPNEE